MNTKLTEGKLRDQSCLRFKAWITPNKKHGIKKRYQKTWVAVCLPPYLNKRQLVAMFEAEAERWHARIMDQIFSTSPKPTYVQQEIQ